MKKNKTNNNKFKNNNKRKRKINKLNNQRFHITRYPFLTKPTSYGPGTYLLAVTKTNSGVLDPQVIQQLYTTYMINNPELERVNKDFKYVKLLGITISFFQRNLPSEGNLYPAYLTVNFDGNETQNLRLQDNTKIVSPFIPRLKQYKFYPPSIAMDGVMLNKWIPVFNLGNYDSILLQIFAPSNTTSWIWKVDISLLFKRTHRC